MFNQSNQRYVRATLQLCNGTMIRGEIGCGLTAKLENALNSEANFLQVIDETKSVKFVAKHQIASVEQQRPLKRAALPETGTDSLAWHEVLRVGADAPAFQVREAYHALAKMYHPDIYSDALPPEIRRYASDMFAAISQAYTEYKALTAKAA